MNRRILIQVAAPAVVIGFLLFGACLVSAWYINRLQTNIANIRSQNVASLRAAQQLEISLRQLRFHCFLYLLAPSPAVLADIDQDNDRFGEWLARAHESCNSPEEDGYVRAIAAGFDDYQKAFLLLREE